MFPAIDKGSKHKESSKISSDPNPSFDRIVADNTTRMVEILQAVVKSNDTLNSKTDSLISVSEHMTTLSENMARISQQMMALNEENIKWLKRLDKRMYYMNQSLVNSPAVERPLPHRDRGFDRDIDSSPSKHTHHIASHDGRLKMFEERVPLENLMRKDSELRHLSKIQIPFNTAFLNQLKEGTADITKINEELATWVGELFRQITTSTYEKYTNSIFSEEEARLAFCEILILNALSLMGWFREQNRSFWNRHRYNILEHINKCSQKILGFLKTKVPRNKKNFKSLEFENLVERVNNSEDPRYDILKNTGIKFELKKGKDIHYIREIKLFFNKLITEVDKEYPEFMKRMLYIFNGKEEHNDEVKYLIGKKFKDNIPLFTEEELGTLNFKSKSPEILRILIKWLQEMEDMITSPEEYIMKKKAFKSFKDGATESVAASENIRKAIITEIKQATIHEKEQFRKLKDILLDLEDNVSELVSIKPKASEYLDHEDIKAIKFSQLISESLPFLAVSRIEMIVKICRSLQSVGQPEQNITGEPVKSGILQYIDLLTFSVYDLLRCKCIGGKKVIEAIYQRLRNEPYFQIIRIKNRLDTPLNDIMINCKIKGSPIICEIQMLITNELITQKSTKNEHFNHYLYELERSKFGPLCEACIIINNSDPRMQYIDEMKKIKMKMPALTTQQEQGLKLAGTLKKCYNGHVLEKMDYSLPFICTICSIFSREYSSCFNSYFCEPCNLLICPSCLLDRLSDHDKKEIYFKNHDNFKMDPTFFKENFYELKNFDSGRKLSHILKEILKDNACEYCMIVSYSEGAVTKKAFKLVKGDVVPTYFTMTKKTPNFTSWEKYDIVVLFQEKDIAVKSPKDIVKAGEIDLTNSFVSKEMVEKFAMKERMNLKCIEDDNIMLIIDFDESEDMINNVVKEIKVNKIVQDCKINKNTTLDISSTGLCDVSILAREAKNLKHVLTVVADENSITTLEPFWQLQNLKKVSLKYNDIKDYDSITIENPFFIDLFMAYNKFESFPLLIAPYMTRVSFKKNKLVNISKLSESELPQLEELGLADNKIEVVPKMNLPSIKKLVLGGNRITDISVLKICEISTVETLELEENKISELPSLNLPKLKKLSARRNQIRNLDNLSESKLPSLETLVLSENSLTVIPKLIISKLKFLDLSKNKLSSLSNITCDQFPELLELKVTHNLIKTVPQMNFAKLERLDLGFNEISRLSEGTGEGSMFFKSKLPCILSLAIALNNSFRFRQIVLMELERWFSTLKHIE